MNLRIPALALAILWTAQSAFPTTLAGSFKYPNGGAVSGSLNIRLERTGLRNTCSTPSIIVPTAPTFVTVSGGAISGSPDLTPSDCLSTFQAYLALLTSGTTSLGRWHVWLANAGGGLCSPVAGNKYLSPWGLSTLANGNQMAFFVPDVLGGFKAATTTVSVGSGVAMANFSINWPSAFADATYTGCCVAIDNTAPTSPKAHISSISTLTRAGMTGVVTNDSGGSARTATVTCRGRAAS